MDLFVLKALVDALQPRLQGARLSKVSQLNPHDLLLRLRRQRPWRLLLSTQPEVPCLFLTEAAPPALPAPPRFAALLRARLHGLRLHALTVRPYERVVCLAWSRPGEAAPAFTLVHELTGQRANVVLLDAQGTVVDALKPENLRLLAPGQPYCPPAPPRRHLGDLTLAALQALGTPLTADALRRALVGLSPQLAAELVHRSQGQPQACWSLLQALRQQYDAGCLTLWRCTTATGEQHLSVLPLTHGAASAVPCHDVPAAVAAYYQRRQGDCAVAALRQRVVRQAQRQLERLRRKLDHLAQDRRRLEAYLPYQRYGTLLLGQQLPRGATQATVIDYYHPEQPLLTIPLDPRKSVRDNAEAYFRKYRKAKNGLAKVEALLAQGTAEAERLTALLAEAAQSQDVAQLQALAQALAPQLPAASPAAAPAPQAVPYRTFTSSDGYRLYCGKSAQGNAWLLRQVARPDDLWFHAYGRRGAHVVLKVPPHGQVPARTLQEAAALAAFYSQGREAATVAVMYAQVKDVRASRGGGPGQVQVQRYRLLEVTPALPGTPP
ncbi:MAG: hypothetical protein KatS3mg131_2180 [Candidatus Tectimicrobiota bacterium]|nr:MAG: hypothetical protein KatS3mg131_2180 [Candidatus Tectomicrobia bacterium]